MKQIKSILPLASLVFFFMAAILATAETIGERPVSFTAIPANGQFKDDTGDVPLECTDMVGGAIDITDSKINIKIQVRNLPEKLPFNKKTTAENSIEYRWGVEFDVNGNNTEDFTITADHFKAPGEPEITDYLYQQVYPGAFKNTGQSTDRIAEAQMMVNGNVIFLSVMKSAHPDLAKITKQSRVRFFTVSRNDRGTVVLDCIQK